MTDQELFDTLSKAMSLRATDDNDLADLLLEELTEAEVRQVLNKAIDVYVNRSLKSIEVSEHLSYAAALAEVVYGPNHSVTSAVQAVAETVAEILA